LIALGAEQAAEAARWRYQVDQSRDAMRRELSDDDALQAYARAAVTGCLALQLDGMQRAIDAGASPAAIIALAKGYRPPARNWETDAFQSAMASGVSSHMAAAELVQWSRLYSAMPTIRERTAKEEEFIASLRGGLASDRPMADEQRDRATRNVEALRTANRLMDLMTRFVLYQTPPLGAMPSVTARAAILADAKQVYGSCSVAPDLKAPAGIDSQFDSARRPLED
jgi:hypothetical protein